MQTVVKNSCKWVVFAVVLIIVAILIQETGCSPDVSGVTSEKLKEELKENADVCSYIWIVDVVYLVSFTAWIRCAKTVTVERVTRRV